MSQMIGAEEVPFLQFRGRRVFLEKTDKEERMKEEGERKCKTDCLAFALVFKKMLEKYRGSREGLIIVPDKSIRI